MPISFRQVRVGVTYTRHQLANLWGYRGYQALARGLVTPAGDNKLIMFITEGDHQQQTPQKYSNHFDGHTLKMEGPEDHFAESRMLCAHVSGEEIHLFHRARHRDDFTYCGQVRLVTSQIHRNRPSEFSLEVI